MNVNLSVQSLRFESGSLTLFVDQWRGSCNALVWTMPHSFSRAYNQIGKPRDICEVKIAVIGCLSLYIPSSEGHRTKIDPAAGQ